MLTDDPGTPGSGMWEINSAYMEQRTTEERVRSFPHVDFNYGLGEHVQLKLETGWLFVDSLEGVKNGLDNSLLGVKWRFADQERSGAPALSGQPGDPFRATAELYQASRKPATGKIAGPAAGPGTDQEHEP